MARAFARWACTGACLAVLIGSAVAQSGARIALVIGNTAYPTPVPACAASARAVVAALTTRGFDVMERSDMNLGEFDAAISNLAHRMEAAPGANVLVYFCGRATEFNGRAFLLPVTAVIDRDFDLLTQGVLAKVIPDALVRGGARTAILVLDAFPKGVIPEFAGLSNQAQAAEIGLLAANEPSGEHDVTRVAAALAADIASPSWTFNSTVASVQQRLAKAGSTQVVRSALSPPRSDQPAPPPAPVASAAPGPTIVAPSIPQAAAPPAAPSTAAAPAPAGAQALAVTGSGPAAALDEARMTEADRRRIQLALAAGGHYNGRIDGNLGPETRSAIKRFQIEIRAEPSGVLTPEQTARLLQLLH